MRVNPKPRATAFAAGCMAFVPLAVALDGGCGTKEDASTLVGSAQSSGSSTTAGATSTSQGTTSASTTSVTTGAATTSATNATTGDTTTTTGSSGPTTGTTSTATSGTTTAGGTTGASTTGPNTTGTGTTGTTGPAVGTVGCGAAAWPPDGVNNVQTLNVKDSTGASSARTFIVSLPSGYNASQPQRVVFAWHYAGGTAAQIAGSSFGGGYYGVQKLLPDAIYVAPQGLTDAQQGMTGWPNTNGGDVAFARAMIDWMGTNYCIDKNRLLSTGMSYGGIMSDTIACQMSDVFRAIGVMSGSLFGGTGRGGSTCVNHPIAAWMTHGTADTTVPITGGETARDRVLADNHCGTTTQPIDPAPCVAYDGCDNGYPVVWCPVDGEGHTIPSFAASAIASFFKPF